MMVHHRKVMAEAAKGIYGSLQESAERVAGQRRIHRNDGKMF